MNVGLFGQSFGGTIPCVDAPANDFNGGTPVTDEKLCVTSIVGGYFVNGLQYTEDGRVCVNLGPSARIAARGRGGIPLGSAGRVICVVGGEIASYLRGIPLSPAGKVVLENDPGVALDELED